jgi:hypothetical protein
VRLKNLLEEDSSVHHHKEKKRKKLEGASSSSSSRASVFFLFHNGLKDVQKKLPQTKKRTHFSLDNQNLKLQTSN